VTINGGDKAIIDGSGSGGGLACGSGSSWPSAFQVTADNVTIENFQIQNFEGDGVHCGGYGILAQGSSGTPYTGLSIQNVDFINVKVGVNLTYTNGAVITGNTYTIPNSTYQSNVPLENIAISLADISSATIQNNSNFNGGGILITSSTLTGLVIQDNVVQHQAMYPGLEIDGSTLTGAVSQGIAVPGAVIQGNTFANNQYGMEFTGDTYTATTSGTVTAEAVDARFNSIHGNTASANAGVYVNGGTNPAVDAEFIWWGVATGPTNSNNPGGTGDAVSANVNFSNFSKAAPGTSYACRGTENSACATNVTTQAVTISWSSYNSNEDAYVLLGPSIETAQTYYDDRGQYTYDQNHHVTITGLLPSTVSGSTYTWTTYNYWIVSGGATYGPFTVTTAVDLGNGSQPSPGNPNMFQVERQDHSTLAAGALAYAQLKSSDGTSASAWESVVLDASGVAAFFPGTFRTSDLKGYFATSGAQLTVFVDGANNGFANETRAVTAPVPTQYLTVCDAGCWTWQETVTGCYANQYEPTATSPATSTCQMCDITKSRTAWSPQAAATACRPALGAAANNATACDIASTCDGSHTYCPDNAIRTAGFVCRASVNAICDPQEICDGTTANCPADEFYGAGAPLGALRCASPTGGVCDYGTWCDSGNKTCDVQEFTGTENPTQICQVAGTTGPCDAGTYCDPKAVACDQPSYVAPNTACGNHPVHSNGNVCDMGQFCDGTDAACHQLYAANTVDCRTVSAAGLSTYCASDAYCPGPGSMTCPANPIKNIGGTCNDGNACDSPDTCNSSGYCIGTPNSGQFLTYGGPTTALAGGVGTTNITWNYNGCSYNYGVDSVNIYASVDNGATWIAVATAAPDTGTYPWPIPTINESVKVKIQAMKSGATVGTATSGALAVSMPHGLTITNATGGAYNGGAPYLRWSGGNADVYRSTNPLATKIDASDWVEVSGGSNVSSPFEDTTATFSSTQSTYYYYRLTSPGATAGTAAFDSEIGGATATTLNDGYTLIGMHFDPAGATTSAQSLLTAIDGTVTDANSLTYWDSAAQWWDVHYEPYSSYDNFTLQMGAGYFIQMIETTNWLSAGLLMQEQFSTPISFDFTLMSFPTGEFQTADAVLQAVAGQGGANANVALDAIYSWNASTNEWAEYATSMGAGSGYNFAIQPDQGYFVYQPQFGGQPSTFSYNPMNVAVTKSGSTGFTVTWTTLLPTVGYLKFYGTSKGNTPTNYFDSNSYELDSTTAHSVTVTGLTAGTYYYGLDISGVVYNEHGTDYKVTLP
jgi:hypothetical protein